METTPERSVEEIAKEIIAKVKYFAGKGQYPENPELEEAYLDGVNTAMAMLYVDLTGTPKTKGFLQTERQKREEVVEVERSRAIIVMQAFIAEKGEDYPLGKYLDMLLALTQPNNK